MTNEELDQWADDFAAFHARFAHLFVRREPREQAIKYLRTLMAPIARKNGWQMAEVMGDQTPDATQRLLYQADWDADRARDVYVQFVCETFGDADGIGVVDESGFIKKGTHSVGVKRQYSGTAGKVENCQIGTFLSYASAFGHVFVDRRLYLPEEWSADPARRAQAQVPADVVFQTKPQQAIAILESAWAHGVPMRWVCGDEVYGESTALARLWRAVGVGMCWRSAQHRADLAGTPGARGTATPAAGSATHPPTLGRGCAGCDHREGRRERLAGARLATLDRGRGRERAADLRLGLSAGGRESRPVAGPRRLVAGAAFAERPHGDRLLCIECAGGHAIAQVGPGGRHPLHRRAVY